MIDKKLLAILACPICKKGLIETQGWLGCKNCQLKYPVENNIPVLLPQKAKKVSK